MSVGALLVAFVLTALLVPVVGLSARAMGLFAKVTDDRWHRRPVPHLGGVAMCVALVAALWYVGALQALMPLVILSVAMFGIGLVDDLRPIKPVAKFVLQLAATAVFLSVVSPVRVTGQPVLDFSLAFLWIVGITNAFNLLDNIDGLAGGVSAIASGSLLLVLWLSGTTGVTSIVVAVSALVGVSLGFLLHNFKPASIFMGDSGSHLIGSFVAGAVFLVAPSLQARVVPVGVIPVVLLLIPIFDTTFVTVTRGLAGRSAFAGGRDHTSHRLVALGIGERRAVLLLYGLTFTAGCTAVGFVALSPAAAWGFVAIFVAVLALVGLYLGHIHATRDGQALQTPPLPSELTVRYRIYEVALDVVLIASAYYLAFLARFREPEFSHFLPYFTSSLPVVVGTQMISLWVSGKYRQVWRTLGPSELMDLFRGTLTGVGASVIIVLYIDRFVGYSRSVFAFDALLASMFIVLARVGLGAMEESLRRRRASRGLALVYGAGRGGALAVRELLQNGEIGLMPNGFIDDDPAKRRLRVEGFPVLGTLDDVPALLTPGNHGITTVIVAIQGLPTSRFEQLSALCAERGLELRRFRFALETVEPIHTRERARAVVRFKRS